MAEIVVEIFGRVLIEFVGIIITESVRSYAEQKRIKKSILSCQNQKQSKTQHNRAVLIASSNITFGNACERLINIAFRTSQTFPTIMGTYGNVDQYLRKELAKQYSNENFHIIISENKNFGFSVDDREYFAEIKQDLYHVLIFTTKEKSHIKSDTHIVNDQMLFKWN